MSEPTRAKPFAEHDHVHVVVETPAGTRTKYAWDPALRAFAVSKLLPAGMSFPYDFGFVPDTKADDGDPLDALILADEPLAMGAVAECRVLGVLELEMSEPTDAAGALVRNDRLVVVPVASVRGTDWHELADLPRALVDEIVEFFRTYVTHEGRKFHLVGKRGRAEGISAIKRCS
jgi:inorganic pyrophosphatase